LRFRRLASFQDVPVDLGRQLPFGEALARARAYDEESLIFVCASS
jgi:hypothetical protein